MALQLALLALAIVAWVYGIGSGWLDLQDPGQVARRSWVAATLVVWVAFGAYGLARLLVLAVGRELVEVDGRRLRMRREVWGIGRWRAFELGHVRGLRHATLPQVGGHSPGRPRLPLPLLGGSIRFACGKRTHEFGFGTDWKDMEAVLHALRQVVPVAGTDSGRR